MSSPNPPISISLPHIHALAEVAKFVSHEKSQPNMHELRLRADGKDRRIEATNGSIIAMYRWETSEDISIDAWIPVDLILNSAQNIPKKRKPEEVFLTQGGSVWYASGTGTEGAFKYRKLSDATWKDLTFPNLHQRLKDSARKHSSGKSAQLYRNRLRSLCRSLNEIKTVQQSWSSSELQNFSSVLLNSVDGRMSFLYKRNPYKRWAEASLTKRVPCVATGQRVHVGVHPLEFGKILLSLERINEAGAIMKFPDGGFENLLMESGSGRAVFLWMPAYVPSMMGNRATGIYDLIYAQERQRMIDEVNSM